VLSGQQGTVRQLHLINWLLSGCWQRVIKLTGNRTAGLMNERRKD